MMNKKIVSLLLLTVQIIFCPGEGIDIPIKTAEQSTNVIPQIQFRWHDSMFTKKPTIAQNKNVQSLDQQQTNIDTDSNQEDELDRRLAMAEQNKKSYEQSFSRSEGPRQLSSQEEEIIRKKLAKLSERGSLSKQTQEKYKKAWEDQLLRVRDYKKNKSEAGPISKRNPVVTIESVEKNNLEAFQNEPDKYVAYLKTLKLSDIQFIDPKVLSETITQEIFEKLLQDPNLVSKFTKNQLQVIDPKIFSELSQKAVRNLFNQLNVLSKFTETQLKAISTERLSRLSNKNMEDISEHEDILSKFDQDQRVAMIHLDEIDEHFLRQLLTDPSYEINLNTLSKKQIQEINPKLLSDVVYYKLPKQIDKSFVEKLSLEQIIKLHEDHLGWGLHNLRTSFKQNFTPDALEYINEQVKKFETNKKKYEAQAKELEKEIALLEKEQRG